MGHDCLSAIEHGAGAIGDHLQHYFACLEISERLTYLDKNSQIWQHEKTVEIEIAKAKRDKVLDDEALIVIQKQAEEAVDKIIVNLAIQIESQYRRTEVLLAALAENDDRHYPKGTDNIPLHAKSTNELLYWVRHSHNAWISSKDFKEGIQKVQAWRTGKPGKSIDVENTGKYRAPSMMSADRKYVRDHIRAHEPSYELSDGNVDEYNLERDINAYVIRYASSQPPEPAPRQSVSAPKQPEQEPPMPERVPTQAEQVRRQSTQPPPRPLEASQSASGVEKSNITESPTHTEFPDLPWAYGPRRKKPDVEEDFLEGQDDNSDHRFKGRFPNQKIALNLLLGEGQKSTGGTDDNIMWQGRTTEDSQVVRYFHMPANNMDWVEVS
jgi:hypothetical protein